MAEKPKKPRWYIFSRASHDKCNAALSNGTPHGLSIYIEHNMRYAKGAPAVNRLARELVKFLNARES